MQWTIADGYTNFTFECDVEQIKHALNADDEDLSEFGSLISKCQDILVAFPSFKVQRNRNQIAHLLARQSFSLDTTFMSYSPLAGMDHILFDVCFDSNH
ncbi:hypothetical protein LINPERHAP2_LOCUS9091 [Linum perenne]